LSRGNLEIVWEEGSRKLADDPAFGPVVRQVGPVRLRPPAEDPFAQLCRSIVYQQLAGDAARAIHGRLVEALDGSITPGGLRVASGEDLRSAGVSRSKSKALRDLADRVADGTLELDDLDTVGNDEVVRRLTTVWGIGEWTARMFLLFHLRRPDVWPAGDLGVRKGWARLHGLEEIPSAAELEPRGEPYRPWRSAAAWYCWRAVEVLAPGD
jgi:3-methyladenine DNA glycosylase/8-oxoguanine DNA glycosylase